MSTDRQQVRAALVGASIARYCHDQMQRGEGAPTHDDMRLFIEESEALAELWDEVNDG